MRDSEIKRQKNRETEREAQPAAGDRVSERERVRLRDSEIKRQKDRETERDAQPAA